MLKIVDWYIIKKFLGTFVYSLVLMILIAVVIDISEKLDDFLKKGPTFFEIFKYYLGFIPYIGNLLSPVFIFIAVIFFTSKMASNSEIVAILASGVSFGRYMRPYIISAGIIASVLLFLNNFVIPPANRLRNEFENKYVGMPYDNYERNIHRQIGPGLFIYFEGYNVRQNIGYRFSMEKFDKGRLIQKTNSEIIRWDSIKKLWTMENINERIIKANKDEDFKFIRIKDIHLNMHPSDFGNTLMEVETMNYFELNEFIEKEKFKGSDSLVYYEIEKYLRLAIPFAAFVLTIIGIAVASRKARGGIGIHLGLGLIISFSFIMFAQVTITYSLNAGFPAMFAVWIPNVIYFFIGLFLLKIAPK